MRNETQQATRHPLGFAPLIPAYTRYLVDPEWQGGGLGRELQTLLIAKARALGFRGLRAQVFAHNAKMIQLAKSSGLTWLASYSGRTDVKAGVLSGGRRNFVPCSNA